MYGYASASLAFLILSILLITSWRGRLQGMILMLASLATLLWSAVTGAYTAIGLSGALLPQMLEVIKDAAWYYFLFKLLPVEKGRAFLGPQLRPFFILLLSLCLLMLGVYLHALFIGHVARPILVWNLAVLGNALLSVAGLVLVEQLFRNTPPEQRWAIKYLCFGVGGMFAYDFYLYSDALLFRHITPWVWNARGLVYTIVVPLIAVAAARNPKWSLDVFVSRSFVFHGAALLFSGLYLLVMAAGGYYIRYYGGDWGGVAQIVFIFGALIILLMIMCSGHFRAYLRVFLNKHFFSYKYDYREEWLNFIGKLFALGRGGNWREQAIQALADIIDSPGGVLWEKKDSGLYEIMAHYSMPETGLQRLSRDSPLIHFLEETKWVVNLEEYRSNPAAYPSLELPSWLLEARHAWLIIPLLLNENLLGLMLLAKPRAPQPFSWEDNDILKTAGAQLAAFLAQQHTTQELINARQFEATSRLSAFMMHDLKNMMAQLSLLVSNAVKYKHNPDFIDDMIMTVDNTVGRMERMLEKLNTNHDRQKENEEVDLVSLLREIVAMMAAGSPVPQADIQPEKLMIKADGDRLSAVIAHIIRNAQDATPETGRIMVKLYEQNASAVIEVEDTGCGMDQNFIRERLFQPFDSTKGSSGMGIGAYECSEYIREVGGDIDVNSRPGKGTLFRISIPLFRRAPAASFN